MIFTEKEDIERTIIIDYDHVEKFAEKYSGHPIDGHVMREMFELAIREGFSDREITYLSFVIHGMTRRF